MRFRRDDGVVGGTIIEDFADSRIPGLDTGVLAFIDDIHLGDSDTAAAR
ncbi:hypothetical protein [Rhodococcus sp. 077-4]